MYKKTCIVCQTDFEVKLKNQKLCSRECKGQWNFLLAIKRCEEKVQEPMRTYLKREYEDNQRSYRSLMKDLGCTNRTITRMLEWFDIAVRRGSDAVKAQWNNNEERRRTQGQIFKAVHEGKPSSKRLSIKIIEKRLLNYNLKLLQRSFVQGYSILECECILCKKKKTFTLHNINGCAECSRKTIGKEQRKPFEDYIDLFEKAGLVLLESESISIRNKVSYICPDHSDIGVQYTTYQLQKKRGKGCPSCVRDDRLEKRAGHKTDTQKAREDWRLKEWREAVYKKDKYTCQCCGDNRGGNLQAHHIKNFSDFPHLRFDIDNGITLCEECHNPSIKGSFHYIYGTKNNTLEQLETYIKHKKKKQIG